MIELEGIKPIQDSSWEEITTIVETSTVVDSTMVDSTMEDSTMEDSTTPVDAEGDR